MKSYSHYTELEQRFPPSTLLFAVSTSKLYHHNYSNKQTKINMKRTTEKIKQFQIKQFQTIESFAQVKNKAPY